MIKKKKPAKRITLRDTARLLAKLNERLDDFERSIGVIEDRQIMIARTLAPLVYDLRNGGWNIPSSLGGRPDDIAEMVQRYDD